MVEAGIIRSDEKSELIDGEIIAKELPMKSAHATAISLCAEAMRQVFGEGYVIRVQLPLTLSERDEPLPDVAMVEGTIRDYERAHSEPCAVGGGGKRDHFALGLASESEFVCVGWGSRELDSELIGGGSGGVSGACADAGAGVWVWLSGAGGVSCGGGDRASDTFGAGGGGSRPAPLQQWVRW